MHVPGLKVAVPSTPRDAKGLLTACIFDDDPCIFMETMSLLFTRGPVDYYAWAGIFHPQWMKMLTFATIVGLLYHVWVGMRDVLMDYIKPVGVRFVLQVLVIVWLLGCAGWAIQVLWRV